MKNHFVVWNVTAYHLFEEADTVAEVLERLTAKYGPLADNVMIRPYLLNEPMRTRYPNLIRACKWVATLCDSEAAHAIAMFKMGFDFGGEAVNHYGGPAQVVKSAIQFRPKPTTLMKTLLTLFAVFTLASCATTTPRTNQTRTYLLTYNDGQKDLLTTHYKYRGNNVRYIHECSCDATARLIKP